MMGKTMRMKQRFCNGTSGVFLLLALVLTGFFGCSDKGDPPPVRPTALKTLSSVVPGVNPDFTEVCQVDRITGTDPADVVRLVPDVDWSWDPDTGEVDLHSAQGYPLYLNLVGRVGEAYGAVTTCVRQLGDVVAANEVTTLAVRQVLEKGIPMEQAVTTLKAQFAIVSDPFAASRSRDREPSLARAMKSLKANVMAGSLREAEQKIYGWDPGHFEMAPEAGFASVLPGFAVDRCCGEAPLDVAFTDLSLGDVAGLSWDFGDGHGGGQKQIVHRFEEPGVYRVTLEVTGGDHGTATCEKKIYVSSPNAHRPHVDFSVSKDFGALPLQVSFITRTSAEVLDYLWDFGDGTTCVGLDPDHTYTTPGSHLVTLTAVGPGGTCVLRKKIHAGRFTAAVATAASDFSSGAHAIVPVDTLEDIRKDLLPTTSDLTMAAHGGFFYRIERYLHDSVAKFSVDAPDVPIWQFSALEPEVDGASSNPHDLIFVNDHKAYLIRYGSTRAWIVNPSATDEAGFKLGEVDLGAYGDQDGLPEMTKGVIVDGRLFVIMQRMDRTHSTGIWQPNRAYVAVIDTASDKEIDTGKGEPSVFTGKQLKGIPLDVENPGAIQFLPENRTLYVQGVGTYPMSGYPGRDTGGIVSVDPASYTTRWVLNDGKRSHPGEALPWGNFSGMSIVSPEKGYFVGYKDWGDNSLYAFTIDGAGRADLSSIAPVPSLVGKNITVMEAGAGLDSQGRLWVCNRTDNGIALIDPETDTELEFVRTGLPPLKTVFCVQ